jgi:hypothetical protein
MLRRRIASGLSLLLALCWVVLLWPPIRHPDDATAGNLGGWGFSAVFALTSVGLWFGYPLARWAALIAAGIVVIVVVVLVPVFFDRLILPSPSFDIPAIAELAVLILAGALFLVLLKPLASNNRLQRTGEG